MIDLDIAPSVVFSDMFRMAVIYLMRKIPVDVSDETAEAVMREVTDNIDTNPNKLKHTIKIIYARAMGDGNWAPVAVKLLTDLCHLIPATLDNPNVLADRNVQPYTGARLVRHHIYKRLLSDFDADLQKTQWSSPRIWLVAELAVAKSSPLYMSKKTSVWVVDMMARSEHLFENGNLDLFIEYVDFVARDLDEHPTNKMELTRILEKVRQRAEKTEEDLMFKVKITWLIALRKTSWDM
jgi:uncharacterized protein (UPF0216 family)